MHETHPVEKELRREAEKISKKYGGAPVIIVVGGTGKEIQGKGRLDRTMTASSIPEKSRVGELFGLLQTSIQIESIKHFCPGVFQKKKDVDSMVTC
ncbi:MAG: hypothetical protein ACLFVG_05520 [Candidatus Aminicenantes bacterium]